MRKGRLLALLLLAAAVPATADRKTEFRALLDAGAYTETLALLAQWEKEEPRNPEVYIGWFNCYLSMARIEEPAADSGTTDWGDAMAISDPRTGETWHLSTSTIYAPATVGKGLVKLNVGLQYALDRLDVWFGKVWILDALHDYVSAGRVVAQVLERSAVNANRWYWSNGSPVSDAENQMINSLQDYYRQWFESGTEEGLDAVLSAGAVQMRVYPRQKLAFNNVGYAHVLRGEYAAGLSSFLACLAIDPSDTMVMNNIAVTYVNLGNTSKAAEYYRKIIEVGTEDEKQYAQEQLDGLATQGTP